MLYDAAAASLSGYGYICLPRFYRSSHGSSTAEQQRRERQQRGSKVKTRRARETDETRSGLFWDFLRTSDDVSFVDTGMFDSDEVFRVLPLRNQGVGHP